MRADVHDTAFLPPTHFSSGNFAQVQILSAFHLFPNCLQFCKKDINGKESLAVWQAKSCALPKPNIFFLSKKKKKEKFFNFYMIYFGGLFLFY